RMASPKAFAKALPLSLRLRWAAMLSKLNGSVSARSGNVAPWRTTMTNPPVRSVCTTLLLSPDARAGAAKLDAASRLQNAASAATVRLDRIGIVRLLLVDE